MPREETPLPGTHNSPTRSLLVDPLVLSHSLSFTQDRLYKNGECWQNMVQRWLLGCSTHVLRGLSCFIQGVSAGITLHYVCTRAGLVVFSSSWDCVSGTGWDGREFLGYGGRKDCTGKVHIFTPFYH
uniref:Uncharacterized protein n=1 Tax=Anopheles albimanus TaxID=7167 RepID=A0A182FXI0_ANOAL